MIPLGIMAVAMDVNLLRRWWRHRKPHFGCRLVFSGRQKHREYDQSRPIAAIGVIGAPRKIAELTKVNTTEVANKRGAVNVDTRAAASYQS